MVAGIAYSHSRVRSVAFSLFSFCYVTAGSVFLRYQGTAGIAGSSERSVVITSSDIYGNLTKTVIIAKQTDTIDTKETLGIL